MCCTSYCLAAEKVFQCFERFQRLSSVFANVPYIKFIGDVPIDSSADQFRFIIADQHATVCREQLKIHLIRRLRFSHVSELLSQPSKPVLSNGPLPQWILFCSALDARCFQDEVIHQIQWRFLTQSIYLENHRSKQFYTRAHLSN